MSIYLNRKPVDAARIIRIQADGNYSVIHLDNNQRVLMALTLMEYQRQLPGFVRVHRRHLINPAFVVRMHYHGVNNCFLEMPQSQLIQVSKHRLTGHFRHDKPTLEQVLAACRETQKDGRLTN